VSPVTLCFHAADGEWGHRVAVPPSQLLAQVRAIRRVRRVHVTFDDAFRNIGSVFPDLLALGVPVTIFVCTGFTDRGGAPLTVPELADQPHERLETMTWDELREWRERGVGVGSHTVTHPHLRALSDDELRTELVDSRRRIEEELDRACLWLAYPYGEHDARVRAGAHAAGYAQAFSLRTAGRGDYACPRVALNRRDSIPRALLKASPLHYPVGELLERFRSRRGTRPQPT
jgi:peptidoglycan/xylan/chitin deacetylase (PgdA/CDA1 family)